MEFLSPEGLRQDGRRPAELRRCTVSVGPLPHADGSAWVELGNTRVVAAVFGPYVPVGARGGSGADLRCEVSTAAFSTGERRRQAARRDRRAAEASASLQAALSSTVLLHLLPPSARVDVAVQVLASDGATLAGSITAAGAALADAGIAMRDVVAAAAATKLDGACLLDPNQAETNGGGPAVVVAAHVGALPSDSTSTSSNNAVVAFQADGSPAASVEDVEALAALAADGCRAVGGVVRAALGESVARCAAVREVALAGGVAAVSGDADMVGAA